MLIRNNTFFAVIITSVNILLFFCIAVSGWTLFPLQLMYKIILSHDILITPAIHGLYLCVELSLLLVQHA
jgi:hypothetical protein